MKEVHLKGSGGGGQAGLGTGQCSPWLWGEAAGLVLRSGLEGLRERKAASAAVMGVSLYLVHGYFLYVFSSVEGEAL